MDEPRLRLLPRILIIVFGGAMLAACSSRPTRVDLEPVSVCDAAKAPIGQTIVVFGEFNGYGYEFNSNRVFLSSAGVCGPRGAGSIFAEMVDREEAEKFSNKRPRGKRLGAPPGEEVRLQGVVKKIEDGRFVTLTDGLAWDAR